MNDEPEYVYQCAYCGRFTPVEAAYLYYIPGEQLLDGRIRVVPGTYCSPHCGRQNVSVHFGGAA